MRLKFIIPLVIIALVLLSSSPKFEKENPAFSIHRAVADEGGIGGRFRYADDDTTIVPYFREDLRVTSATVLGSDTNQLPYDYFWLYASGGPWLARNNPANASVYIVVYIQETVTYQNENNETITKKTWTDKILDFTIELKRGKNPAGHGPYTEVRIGSNHGFGEIRPEKELVIVSYRNLNITFYHKTSKYLQETTRTYGDIAMELLFYVIMILIGVAFVGGYGGRKFQDFAGYVPAINPYLVMLIMVILFGVGLFWYLLAPTEERTDIQDVLLDAPVFVAAVGVLLSAFFFASKYRQNLKKTMVWKLPNIPVPNPDDEDEAWNIEKYKRYFKKHLDLEFHKLLSYTTNDGKEFFISEKRKDSWYDAIRRAIRRCGIFIDPKSLETTMPCTATGDEKKAPPTLEVYHRVIPCWEFKFTQGAFPFGTKAKLKWWHYPLLWTCGFVVLLVSLMFGVISGDLFNPLLFASLGLLIAGAIYDNRPIVIDDDMKIKPVENRLAVDAFSSVAAVKLAENRTEKAKLEVIQEKINAYDKALKLVRHALIMAHDDFGMDEEAKKKEETVSIEDIEKEIEKLEKERKRIQKHIKFGSEPQKGEITG